LVNDGTTDLKVVASYNRTDTTVKVDTIDVKASETQVFGKAADGTVDYATGAAAAVVAADFFQVPANASLTDTEINAAMVKVETALKSLTTGAASLGAAKSQIDSQKSFLSGLSDSIEKGVGTLVDADMNKESARLSALQVQQQLGVQALSIANSSSQSILSLFRG